jgi:ATP-dependent exoDNAse (exonuclease V) alpha subunit
LGITNGSQGIVRQINTTEITTGITHCTSAIVEFPSSRAQLPKLPPKHYPISPITWTFTTKPNGEHIKATRHQLPLQPAFAVTGHSAEGKTLPNVLVLKLDKRERETASLPRSSPHLLLPPPSSLLPWCVLRTDWL